MNLFNLHLGGFRSAVGPLQVIIQINICSPRQQQQGYLPSPVFQRFHSQQLHTIINSKLNTHRDLMIVYRHVLNEISKPLRCITKIDSVSVLPFLL